MLKKMKNNLNLFLDLLQAMGDELARIRLEMETLNDSISDIKSQWDEIILPEYKNASTGHIQAMDDGVNEIYKTKLGLVSFKKAKRAIRDE